MPIFLAQNSAALDSANMWSSDGGSTFADWATVNQVGNTLRANGKTITVNQDITCTQIDTITSGGVFNVSMSGGQTRNIDAIIQAGTTPCVVASGNGWTFRITGNVNGGSSTSAFGINCATAVIFYITGDVSGGTGQTAFGMWANYGSGASQTVNITGSVSGGSGYAAYGIRMNYCNVIISNDVAAGTNALAYGVLNEYYGVLQISGDLTNGLYTSATAGKLIYTPGAGKCIKYPNANSAGNIYYYGKTFPAAKILKDEVGDGAQLPVAGTYQKPKNGVLDVQVSDMLQGITWGTAPSTGTYQKPKYGAIPVTAGQMIEGITWGDGPTTGTYHLPDAAEVSSNAVFGPLSATHGTYKSAGKFIGSAFID